MTAGSGQVEIRLRRSQSDATKTANRNPGHDDGHGHKLGTARVSAGRCEQLQLDRTEETPRIETIRKSGHPVALNSTQTVPARSTMKTKFWGQLGVITLVTSGLAIFPGKAVADIYTFDFHGSFDSSAIGQTVDGLSLDNGTFFEVIYSFDSAATIGPAPGGTQLFDSLGTCSIAINNSFGAINLAGSNGTHLITRGPVGQARLMGSGIDPVSTGTIGMDLRSLGTSAFPDSTPASGIQALENDPATDDLFVLTINGLYSVSGSVSSVSYSIQSVPEPSAAALLALGTFGAAAALRRRMRH